MLIGGNPRNVRRVREAIVQQTSLGGGMRGTPPEVLPKGPLFLPGYGIPLAPPH